VRSELKAHIASKHGPKTFVCEFETCDAAFGTVGQRNSHFPGIHGPKTFTCPEAGCDAAFGKRGELNTHIASKHGPKTFFCRVETCDAAFGTLGELNLHVKQVQDKKQVCPKCQHPCGTASNLKRHLAKCGRLTSRRQAAAFSNGCYAFCAREIGEADRYAEQLVASAVGATVPVLHRDFSTDEQNYWWGRVQAIVRLVAAAIEDPMALYIGSTNAQGLIVDPETQSVPADDSRLVKGVTRRGSHGWNHYTSQTEDGRWVFAASEYPPPGEGFPVPAMIPIAVSFDPTLKTTVAEGRLVRLGREGKGLLVLNPPIFNGGNGLLMEKHGSVLYLLPTTGNVGRVEAEDLFGRQRVARNEKRAARKHKKSSEDQPSQRSYLEDGDSAYSGTSLNKKPRLPRPLP